MENMRVDYVSGRFMIVHAGDDSAAGPNSAYAPGNEDRTNPSVLSLVARDGILHRHQDIDGQIVREWQIRVFEPRNPIVSTATGNQYGVVPFESQPAYGHHYILVASPDPQKTLATIDTEQWSNILVVVQDRLRWLYTQKGVSYVGVYADHDGALEGGIGAYPHLNIVTFKIIPPAIEKEIISHRKSQETRGTCPVCSVINDDESGDRIIMKTDNFVAYCPWSPSYPLEFCIAPLRHAVSIAKISQKEIDDLAMLIRTTIGGLTSMVDGVSYSIVFHLSAERKSSRQIHWHIKVYPMTKKWTGMERGYGIHLNDVSPEDAARRLKSSCKKEFANMVSAM